MPSSLGLRNNHQTKEVIPMLSNKYGKYAVITTHPSMSTHKVVWTSHGQVFTPVYVPEPTLADKLGPWAFAIALFVVCVIVPVL